MGKDTHLINIYLKIHNKQTLTMDDLRYLAQYAPECFEKTCKNVIYNIPEAKPIMEPEPLKKAEPDEQKIEKNEEQKSKFDEQPNITEVLGNIKKVLENIRRLEMNDFPVKNVEVNKVKNLLGNLYMELMFPHNDKETFIKMEDKPIKSSFDKKA